jgi:hypothetical protein
MTIPQSKFTVVLPTQDNATPPDTLVVGQLTSLGFSVSNGTSTQVYVTALATSTPGATVSALFANLVPSFVPVPGTTYSADVYAVDSGGNGYPSASVSWTQAAPVPAAPSGFSVS